MTKQETIFDKEKLSMNALPQPTLEQAQDAVETLAKLWKDQQNEVNQGLAAAKDIDLPGVKRLGPNAAVVQWSALSRRSWAVGQFLPEQQVDRLLDSVARRQRAKVEALVHWLDDVQGQPIEKIVFAPSDFHPQLLRAVEPALRHWLALMQAIDAPVSSSDAAPAARRRIKP